jgi:cyanophycinase
MTGGSVFLFGGGWNPAAYPDTYGRFTAAAGGASARIACVLLDGPDRETHFGWATSSFEAVGARDVYPVYVSADRPLGRADLDGATGIFVGGGSTPAYHAAVTPEAASWLPIIRGGGIPYAGLSAGAMIAATTAIVGGWKLPRDGADLVICNEELSEDREFLDIRPGLGLVPFAVDAHASQYGSTTRLLHAVSAGLLADGWAIDEETSVEFSGGAVSVWGLGSACRVRRDGASPRAEIVTAERH